MKKGGNSNIERKLADLNYPFSEDSWNKMEMLLNEDEDKATGGLAPSRNGISGQGIFRSLGIIAVLVVATLGTSNTIKLDSLSLNTKPGFGIEKQISNRITNTTLENNKTKFSNDIYELSNPLITKKDYRKISVSPQIPNRKHFIQQKQTTRLVRPSLINTIANKIPELTIEPMIPALEIKNTGTKLWHLDLQAGYERLPNSLLLFTNFNNRLYSGINVCKVLNKKISLNFNYTLSAYNSRSNNKLLALEDSSNIISINEDTSSYISISSEADLRNSYSNFTRNFIFSNNLGVSAIVKVKKWNFESGLFYEQIIPQQGVRGNNWGIYTAINRELSKRISLNITGRYGSSTPALDPKLFNNYSFGLGLKYKLK
ncbi:MAG: hypothetical protein P8P48_13775 [Saprospiraceae bacterium]|nr:hypothetical protein [Saprospiraceae bacterium]